jgi:uncharacterized membrane protein (UPF0127 family)
MAGGYQSRVLGALIAVAFYTAGLAACTAEQAMILPVDPEPLVITTAKGDVDITVEVTDTTEEHARGLMFRPPLPQGRGMLFVMDYEEEQLFWMKNTPSPLDLVFAAKDGVIVSIKQGEPLSEASISSEKHAKFVLEIAQGEAARLGIKPGDRMAHRLINP